MTLDAFLSRCASDSVNRLDVATPGRERLQGEPDIPGATTKGLSSPASRARDNSPSGEATSGGMAEATKPGRPCPDCYGAGRVELPVIRESRRYEVVGSRWEICMECRGTGRDEPPQISCPQCADHFTPEGTER